MGAAELAAAWVTAAATGVVAIAAWIQLPLISRQVRELSEQIRLSREAEQNAERRTREWETLKACQRYDYDPVLDEATRRIWVASNQGKDYRARELDPRDITSLLNYLDGIAIGIQQDLYIENIVKDHLGIVFDHAVKSFLDSGIIEKEGFDCLLAVHARWFRVSERTDYHAIQRH